MRLKEQGIEFSEKEEALPNWTRIQLRDHVGKSNNCLIVLDGYVVDATSYLLEHVRVSPTSCKERRILTVERMRQPGGAKLISGYSLRSAVVNSKDIDTWPDASDAFYGGMNIHSWAANQQMKKRRIAKLIDYSTRNRILSDKSQKKEIFRKWLCRVEPRDPEDQS